MFVLSLTIWRVTWKSTHQGPGSALKSITPLKERIAPIFLAATQPELSQTIVGREYVNRKKKSIAIPAALFLLLLSYFRPVIGSEKCS